MALKKLSRVTEETFLEHKRKKKWVDKDGCCGFVLYPRSLFITWGHREYWSWNCFKETSDDNIEVAKLVSVCWLDVRGKVSMAELSPGVTYEGVYKVKLTKSAAGWEVPIHLRLSVPGEDVKMRQVSLFQKPKGEWFELNLGTFKVTPNEEREVGLDLFEHGGHWKSGLIFKELIIRPVH